MAIEKGLLTMRNLIEIIDGISNRMYAVTETPSSAEVTIFLLPYTCIPSTSLIATKYYIIYQELCKWHVHCT